MLSLEFVKIRLKLLKVAGMTSRSVFLALQCRPGVIGQTARASQIWFIDRALKRLHLRKGAEVGLNHVHTLRHIQRLLRRRNSLFDIEISHLCFDDLIHKLDGDFTDFLRRNLVFLTNRAKLGRKIKARLGRGKRTCQRCGNQCECLSNHVVFVSAMPPVSKEAA